MEIEYKIFMIFVYAFELFILIDYCERLFKRKISKSKTLLISSCLYIVLYALCISVNLNEFVNCTAYTIATFIIILVCYNTRILSSVFHSLVISVVMTISESLVIF